MARRENTGSNVARAPKRGWGKNPAGYQNVDRNVPRVALAMSHPASYLTERFHSLILQRRERFLHRNAVRFRIIAEVMHGQPEGERAGTVDPRSSYGTPRPQPSVAWNGIESDACVPLCYGQESTYTYILRLFPKCQIGSNARKQLILVDFQVVDWKYRVGLRFPKSSVEGYSFEKGILGPVPLGLTMIRRFLIGSPISIIVSSVSASILSKPAFFVEWLYLAIVI